MHILTGDQWENRILDYHRPAEYLRIAVSAWAVAGRVSGIYLVRPRSWLTLREYLREFGIRAVFRKIRSRLQERLRNEKFISVGLGRVIAGVGDGEPVLFLALAHPRCVERVVLPPALVRSASPEIVELHSSPGGIRFYESGPALPRLEKIAGWQPESGCALPTTVVEEIVAAAGGYWSRPAGNFRLLGVSAPSDPVTTCRPPGPVLRPDRPRAVLYGLGNYAKTQIIPGLSPRISIASIHELDPTQIVGGYRKRFRVTTDPGEEAAENYDVWLIAGYHHTHAGLAVRALERGAVAVVEKPVVTSRRQLEELISALRRTAGRFYSCFQMRYNPLFGLARRDLQLGPGEPLHITADVFEIPLPPRHWYRWPNSGSHLVSNGCHWLDHFLFMNDFSRPVSRSVRRLANGDTVATVELANGACLLLHLTHLGSTRIGVQEYVAMRRGERTATVINSSAYRSEDHRRTIRKQRVNKMDVYRRMYREISRRIISGEPGDSLESVKITNTLLLDLEEDLQRQLRT